MITVWFAINVNSGKCFWTTDKQDAESVQSNRNFRLVEGQWLFDRDAVAMVDGEEMFIVSGVEMTARYPDNSWIPVRAQPLADNLLVEPASVQSGVTLDELFAEDEE